MPRWRRSRVYWRFGPARGNSRAYADAGGKPILLKAGSETYASTDRDVAADLASRELTALELRRRNRALLGVERSTTLGKYAEYHLVEKSQSQIVQTSVRSQQSWFRAQVRVVEDDPTRGRAARDILAEWHAQPENRRPPVVRRYRRSG